MAPMPVRRRQVWLRRLDLVFGTAFRVDARLAVLALTLLLVERMLPALAALSAKALVDAVRATDGHGIALSSAALAGYIGLVVAIGFPRFVMFTTLNERTAGRIDRQLAELVTGSTGIQHYEDPEFSDRLQVVRERRQMLAEPAGTAFFALAAIVEAAITLSLLAHISPVLLLVLAPGALTLAASGLAGRRAGVAWLEASEKSRSAAYFFTLGTSARSALEVRAYAMSNWLLQQYSTAAADAARRRERGKLVAAPIIVAGQLVSVFGYFAAIFWVSLLIRDGSATAGDLVLAVLLANRAFAAVQGVAGNLTALAEVMTIASAYLWLERYIDGLRRPASRSTPEDGLPNRSVSGLQVSGLRFKYPHSTRFVLDDVTFNVPAGKVVAIVGENGAGKSTLVKILTRLYDPTDGTMLLDGVDIADVDANLWQQRVTGAFQDFLRPYLTMRQAVGIGSPATMDDSRVTDSLLKAGMQPVVANLEAGLDTQLGRSFDGGVELSGGQWQKVAIGRGFMPDAPLLVLLDEPTASLDAQSEEAIYRSFAQRAKSWADDHGAITVLVSHRFSTVHWADLILVLDEGTMVESGTHTELLELGGHYATLFDLHARQFAED
ncbi:ABC transporter ATP-binding protein/permease [Kribbella sp. NBC_00482]|uniref:ABC transporter ATP-binding protein n=1 Tax=Kribbella sp. NBC_00482 TaxID=2975968 RepID=UPI002E199183